MNACLTLNNEYIPVMAESFEHIDDLHTQVKIYDYIYDHAGNHTDDVVFSYQTLLDSGSIKYSAFADIKKLMTTPWNSPGTILWTASAFWNSPGAVLHLLTEG